MWQRIQTLYLVIVGVAMGLFAFSDIFVVSQGSESLILDAWSLKNVTASQTSGGVWGIGALAILSGLLALASIFLYGRRILQARIGVVIIGLLIGLIALVAYTGYTISSPAGAILGVRFALALPFISVVLMVMAVRAIWADEALVRMSQRLR